MTEVPGLLYAFADGAATITLAEPAAGNPLNARSLAGLETLVRRAREDDAHVVVLRAQGHAFSVGGDVASMGGAQDPGAYVEALAESVHRAVSDLVRMDAVVVSVVQGVAAGAGVPLAAAADLVLAAESARFTLAYTKVGLTPDGGSSLLTGTVGLHRALHLALLNPVLSAREAQAMGLVAQVHADDQLDEAVDAVVATLLQGSRSAQVGAKRLLRDHVDRVPEGAMRLETLAIRAAAAGPDGREGVRAFLDKRRPRFGSPDARG